MDDFIVPDDEVDEEDEEDEEGEEDEEDEDVEEEEDHGVEEDARREEEEVERQEARKRKKRRRSVIDDDEDDEDDDNGEDDEEGERPARRADNGQDSSEDEEMVIHQKKRPARRDDERASAEAGRRRKKRKKKRREERVDDEPFSHAALFQQMLQQDEEEKSRKAVVAAVKLEEAFGHYIRVLATAAIGGVRSLRKLHKRDADVGNGFLRGCYNKVESHICTTRESRIGSGAWGAKRQQVLNTVSRLCFLANRSLDEAERLNMCDYRCDLCGRKEGARNQGVSYEIKFSGIPKRFLVLRSTAFPHCQCLAVAKGFPYDGKGIWEARSWATWPECLNAKQGVLPDHRDAHLAALAERRRHWDSSLASRHISSYMRTDRRSQADRADDGERDQEIIDVDDDDDDDGEDDENEKNSSRNDDDYDGGSDGNAHDEDGEGSEDKEDDFEELVVFVGKTCRDRIWRYHNLIHYKLRLLFRIKKFADQVNAQDVDELVAHEDFVESEWGKLNKCLDGALSLDGGLQEREDQESGLGNMQAFLHRNDSSYRPQTNGDDAEDDAVVAIAESDDNDGPPGGAEDDSDVEEDEVVVEPQSSSTQPHRTPATKREDDRTTSAVSQRAKKFSTTDLSARRGYKLQSRIGGRFRDPLSSRKPEGGSTGKANGSGSRRAQQMAARGSAFRRRSAPDIMEMLRHQTGME
eukprot:scaffold1227_cov256-Pinguiococcus_pyrenoidosus.AAC.1